jgi:hypothetical protein
MLYLVLGVLPDATKEILGLWIEQTEGVKFWLRVMNRLRSRIPCTQSSGRRMAATAARVVRGQDPVRHPIQRWVRGLMIETDPAQKIADRRPECD